MVSPAAQREKSTEVEGAILNAARDLLAEGGLAALSMRIVAERVGISATAIYHYFESKQDLIDRVVTLGYMRFGGYLEKAVSRYPEGSVERFGALGEAYAQFAIENQEYFRVLFSMQAKHPKEIEDLPGGGGYHLLRSCVIEAIEAGNIRDEDPDVVSLFLWTCVHGLVTLALACHLQGMEQCDTSHLPKSPVELFNRFKPFILNGVCPSAVKGLPGVASETSQEQKAV